jgi:hypothetical protein
MGAVLQRKGEFKVKSEGPGPVFGAPDPGLETSYIHIESPGFIHLFKGWLINFYRFQRSSHRFLKSGNE